MSQTHSIAIPARGTKWEVKDPDAATETWVRIKGLKTFARNEVAPQIDDESTLESTFKEKSIGLPDAGQINLTAQYNRTDPGQKILQKAKKTLVQLSIRVTLKDGSIEQTQCYVLTFPFSGQATSGSLEGVITLECTGEPDWTEPTEAPPETPEE